MKESNVLNNHNRSLLQPILILGAGRTGSTLLMRTLSESEDTCFPDEYPYEETYLAYFKNLQSVLSQQPGAVENWNRKSLFNSRNSLIGPIPFGQRGKLKRGHLNRSIVKSCINGLYFSLIHTNNKLDAKFYVEKGSLDTFKFISGIEQAKGIFLLRDPRDTIVSIAKFNKKIGQSNFGWKKNMSTIDYGKHYIKRVLKLYRNIQPYFDNGKCIPIRYEDMISDLPSVKNTISEFTGINFNEVSSEKEIKDFQQHSTSKSPLLTIGKWKTDKVYCEDINFLSEKYSSEIEELGY